MPKKNERKTPTLSEQYDQKLRSELYVAMLKLQEIAKDLAEAEERNDEDDIDAAILGLLDFVPDAVDAYFDCIEGYGHV